MQLMQNETGSVATLNSKNNYFYSNYLTNNPTLREQNSAKDNSNSLITIAWGLRVKFGTILKKEFPSSRAILLSNPTIYHYWGEEILQNLTNSQLEVKTYLIPDGEEYKNFSTAYQFLDWLHWHNYDRSDLILAFGGGVVGDLGGLVAALYKRGMHLIMLPTTLIAQIDSCVGGKVAVNHPLAKNTIGTFFDSSKVLIDPELLTTLLERDLKAGLSEVIKYGVITDVELFETLEKLTTEANNNYKFLLNPNFSESLINRCLTHKKRIVAQDFQDYGKRHILNFGHTIGHALEVTSNYNVFHHGEAIAIGMVAAAQISVKLGFCSENAAQRLENLIKNIGLPTRIQNFSNLSKTKLLNEIVQKTAFDKKRIHNSKGGFCPFVIMNSIGSVKIEEQIPEKVIREVCQNLIE